MNCGLLVLGLARGRDLVLTQRSATSADENDSSTTGIFSSVLVVFSFHFALNIQCTRQVTCKHHKFHVHDQKICSCRNIHTPPQKGLEFPGGWGFCMARKIYEMYEAFKIGISRWVGGVFHGGGMVWIFSGITQYEKVITINTKLIHHIKALD